jgi:hypothetical protein
MDAFLRLNTLLCFSPFIWMLQVYLVKGGICIGSYINPHVLSFVTEWSEPLLNIPEDLDSSHGLYTGYFKTFGTFPVTPEKYQDSAWY